MSQGILVLCPFGVDAGLLSKAAELSCGNVRVLAPAEDKDEAVKYGASVVHLLDDKSIADETAFADYLAGKIMQWGSKIVLAPATVQMRNIMPMLAWKLNAGLTADCTALEMDSDALLQTRPAFGNSLVATIRTLSEIQMATVRPGTFPAKETGGKAEFIEESFDYSQENVKILAEDAYSEGKPLSQADIILAGGMGVGSREGFEKLENLAQKLGAGLAASRTAVDAGFAPFRCQVGLTGVTVSPRLYIAVGISGAVQHLAGMSASEKVIAVNSDPKAPIFDYADYGIVGDWEEVVDKIMEELS